MKDRPTKALLLAIALGLWANVASQWIRPVALQAGQGEAYIPDILKVVNQIATGTCSNRKIC